MFIAPLRGAGEEGPRADAQLSLVVLIGFVLAALALNWGFFLQYGRFVVVVVFVHNALALASGYGLARLVGLPSATAARHLRDRDPEPRAWAWC